MFRLKPGEGKKVIVALLLLALLGLVALALDAPVIASIGFIILLVVTIVRH